MFDFLYGIFGYLFRFLLPIVGNYGLALVIFTLFFRVILLPATVKQQNPLLKWFVFSLSSRESEKSIRITILRRGI